MNKKLNFSPTNASNQLRISARNDSIIAIIALILLVSLSFLLDIEILEAVYEYTRAHEEYELDELFIVFVWTSLIAVIYGIRRMSDIKSLNSEISNHAYYDPITQLPNRRLAIEKLDNLLINAKITKNKIVIIFLDFDDFKLVNDTYGHAKGDLLIKSVGERLASQIREGDTLARLGGDEFVLLIEVDETSVDVKSIVQEIIKSAYIPHSIFEHNIYVNYSIGIASYPKDATTSDSLLKAADAAMYKAKEQGKGKFYIYSDELGQKLAERTKLEIGIKDAIANKQLSLVYQPQINSNEGRISGYEALLRWNLNGVNIPPDVFIPIAEQTRVIESIGNWVLVEALRESKKWLKHDMLIAVNISSKQLQMSNFVDSVKDALNKTGVAPVNLELEITETALLSDFKRVSKKLEKLKNMGISIAIDDFGTGYSSLARLKDLQVTRLKIDRSFITDIESQHNNQKIIKAIYSLAANLNLDTVVEGVETANQLSILTGIGFNEMQGYYFSRPIAGEQIDSLTIDYLLVNSEQQMASSEESLPFIKL